MVRKACSTLLAFLADVSRKGMPRLSANSWAGQRPSWYFQGGDSPYLGHCVLDHLLVRHVALVSYEQLVDALRGVPVDLLQPLLDVVKAVHVRDIVDDADAVGAAVVGRSDGAEPFLAGRVPLSQVS
jgi:hypothetical protein